MAVPSTAEITINVYNFQSETSENCTVNIRLSVKNVQYGGEYLLSQNICEDLKTDANGQIVVDLIDTDGMSVDPVDTSEESIYYIFEIGKKTIKRVYIPSSALGTSVNLLDLTEVEYNDPNC